MRSVFFLASAKLWSKRKKSRFGGQKRKFDSKKGLGSMQGNTFVFSRPPRMGMINDNNDTNKGQ
jgi:hypothetical protein